MPSEQIGSAYAEVGFKVNESGLNDAKSKFSSAIGDMESKAKSVGSAIGGALKTGLEVGAVAAAGIATAGLMAFKDLESAASSAASKAVDVNGKSAEEIKAQYDGMLDHVMKVSEELGASTVFTNKQVAETFDVLAAKGVKIADVGTSQLLPFLDLAAATQSDLANVTDLVTGSINAFGLSMNDSQRVADAYAMGMNASSASMETYNYALRQGGAAAAASGMQLEEYLAIVGKLADKNYTGEQSGAALKTAMLALYNPTKAQGEVLEKLGITYDQVDPRTHSFIDTIELLKSKGADIGDFGKVFTDSSGSIMYALSEDITGVRELTASISGSGGLAHTQAQLMLDTEKLTGAYELAKSATEGLVTSIGGALEPAAVKLLNTWTALVPTIKEFATALISVDFGKVGDLLASGIRAGWSKLKDLGGQLLGWLKAVDWGGAGDYIVTGIEAAWNELMSLGGQLLSSLQSVDWGAIGTSLLAAISSAIDSVIDYAAGIYDYFAGIDWAGVWDSLVSAFNSAIEGLSNIGSTILGYFDSIDWGTVGFKIGQAIRDAIQALSDIGSQIWQYLTSADWSGAGSSIAEKIRGGLDKLREFWTEFKTGLSAVDFATAGKEIGDKIKEGLGKITDYAKSIYEKIEKGWDDWIAAGGPKKLGEDFGHSLIKGVADLGKWIYDAIANYWKSNGSTIGSNFSALFNSAINFAKVALQAAYDFVTGFADTVIKAGKGTIGAAILEIIGGAMNDAWDGAGSGLLETAKQWRADAAELWEASPLDLTIEETAKLISGDLPKNGETRDLTYVVSVTGEDITPRIKASNLMPKITDGHLGGITYDQSTRDYFIRTMGATGNYEQTLSLQEWAKQLGESGMTMKEMTDYLESIDYEKFPISEAYKEKVVAAFTEGQNEYEASQKPPGETFKEDIDEAGEGLKEDAKESGDTEVAGAKEDAAVGVAGAKQEAAAKKEAALTFRQQIWKTVSDVNQDYRNTHAAVKIGLDDSGRKWAVIGEVAQKQWQESGKQWADGTQLATTTWTSGVTISTRTLSESFGQISQKMTSAATFTKTNIETAANAINDKVISSANTWKTSAQISTDNLATKVTNVAMTLNTKGVAAADYNFNKQVAGGNWIYEKSVGASNAIEAAGKYLIDAATGFKYNSESDLPSSSGVSSSRSPSSGPSSSASHDYGTTSWGTSLHSAEFSSWGKKATGGKTNGPEMALIGEDGPANPEFIIPTKTKRWDLLYAALRAYGVRGFAEGGATGEAATAPVDPDAMAAYFSITGLASMSKQVQRILNNLKDFFRITWGIIKSEGAVYWKQINDVLTTEVTSFRDSAWQAILDVRNTAISSFQDILAGAKSAFSEMWPRISGYVDDLADGLVSSLEDAGSSTVDAINQMVMNAESSLSAWATKWGETWDQMLTDLSDAQSQISTACSEIAAELAKIGVSVNINASYGGSYGGSDGGTYGGVVSGNSSGDMQFTDCLFEGFTDSCTGALVNPLIYTNPSGVTSYINPMTYHETGGISNYQGTGNSGGSSYQLPPIFAAHGALLDDGPRRIIAGEAGPELVIPATYTRLMDWMAGQVENLRGGGSAQRIVIEDHTEHRWYLDGKEVTDTIMERVRKQVILKGAKPVR